MSKSDKQTILTIPNLLSFIRLCMIPAIMWLYCTCKNYLWAAILLALSWVTDIVDGYIARRFHMVSEFGKAFDPIADKLTQIAMMFCLVTRFSYMLIPTLVLILKEILAGISGLVLLRKSKTVLAADWHGKLTTGALYITMIAHIIWFSIPAIVSNTLIAICTGFMLLSAVLYGIRNFKAVKEA